MDWNNPTTVIVVVTSGLFLLMLWGMTLEWIHIIMKIRDRKRRIQEADEALKRARKEYR